MIFLRRVGRRGGIATDNLSGVCEEWFVRHLSDVDLRCYTPVKASSSFHFLAFAFGLESYASWSSMDIPDLETALEVFVCCFRNKNPTSGWFQQLGLVLLGWYFFFWIGTLPPMRCNPRPILATLATLTAKIRSRQPMADTLEFHSKMSYIVLIIPGSIPQEM